MFQIALGIYKKDYGSLDHSPFVSMWIISRQAMTGGAVNFVPFSAAQGNIGCQAKLLQMSGIHGSGDQLDICGMAQDPRGGNGGFGNAVTVSNALQRLVQSREVLIVNKIPFEEAVLERRPSLDRYVMHTGVFQEGAVVHDRFGVFHIYVHPGGDQPCFRNGKLKLIYL